MTFSTRILFLSALWLSSIILTGQAEAQTDQRMKFVEGLFRTIIEARSQRNRQVPGIQPPVPVAPSNPAVPAPAVPSEVQLYQARIAAYAGETNKLANSMGRAAAQTPALRSYLPEIYAVRSQALLLQQNAAAVHSLAAVEPGFRTLDIAWRDLAYRMKSDRRLDGSCRNSIKNLDQFGNDLCGILGIQADFDRVQATLISAQASAYSDSLLDVLQYELYNQPGCDALIKEGREQMELGRQFASNVTGYSLPEATDAFQQWSISWRQYSAKLQHAFRNAQNARLIRAIGHVRRSQNQLYDLMRIERPIDYDYIDYLSAQCRQASDDLFRNLPMQTLAGLPRNQLDVVFQAERTLSRQFGEFCKSVSKAPNYDRVVGEFVSLESNWKSCDPYLARLPGDIAGYRLTINNDLGEMRHLLQISERLDMNRVLSQAASIEGMAQALFNNLVARAAYIPSRNARSQSLVLSQQFLKNAQIFHNQAASGANLPTLQKGCGALVDSWQACSQVVQSLPASGLQQSLYSPIGLICTQIDPSLAELGVVLAP